jgi:integrase
VDVISRQLGHAHIGTTADTYLHDNDEAAGEAAERLASYMEG